MSKTITVLLLVGLIIVVKSHAVPSGSAGNTDKANHEKQGSNQKESKQTENNSQNADKSTTETKAQGTVQTKERK